MKRVIHGICIVLAFVFIGIGVLGIFLPILPTTPLLIAAAVLFAKSSNRFYGWFIQTSLYDKFIRQPMQEKQMTLHNKIITLGTITIFMAVGFIMSPVWYAKAIITVITAGHYYLFLFRIKTMPKEKAFKIQNRNNHRNP